MNIDWAGTALTFLALGGFFGHKTSLLQLAVAATGL